MNQILVCQNLVDNLRMLLIRLAQYDDHPPEQRAKAIEPYRQYCEGALGIDRAMVARTNNVDQVLQATGLLPKK